MDVKTMLRRYCTEHVANKCVAQSRIHHAVTHLNAFMGNYAPRNVDIPLCREYAANRMQRGVSSSTVRRELNVLSAAANHALRWRHIEPNEVPSIELPPETEPKMVWLYRDELQKLHENATGRVSLFITLAYATAARKETIETLRWHQVDLDAKRIDLNSEGRLRTKKRRPLVPISDAIVDLLRVASDLALNEFVLGSDSCIRYDFDKLTEACGLSILPRRGLRPEARLTPHVLRHSRATHLLQEGKLPFAVANLLGDQVNTVLRSYGHACPDYMESIVS